MTEKIYITPKKTATITCPKCRISKTVDVSKLVSLEKVLKVNGRCPCGHVFKSFIERRMHYRKELKLAGSFVRLVSGKSSGREDMIVRDLSLTGMKFEVYENLNFSEGDVLQVEFRLDDVKNTLIKKQVVIRNIKNSCIGAAFVQTGIEDNTLGFYLMP